MNKVKFFITLFTIALCFWAYTPVLAQSGQNLSGINADDLSDEAVRNYMRQAQAAGYTDAQIIQLAQSRGMSADQVQRLQARVAELRKKDGNLSNSSANNSRDTISQSSRRSNYPQDTAQNNRQRIDIFKELMPKIFGADLFRNSTANTFEPNLKLATPVNYIVGPEDKLQINVYGNSIANWSPEVTPDGNINIPGIGILKVAGKTIEQVTIAIKSKLAANNYAIGRGTNVEVTLGNIRSIKVILQGQLIKPGTYTLSSLSTVFNALYAAGGPSDIGSFRNIEVIRNNKIVRHLDLYDFLVKGSQKDNIALQDQDVIRVPTYRMRVELRGEVKIPALFEMLPGETLQDLINFSGGFTDHAYTALIKVVQVSDQQRRLTDIFESDYKNYTPLRGDKYTVERILDRYENRVIVKGAVFRPGQFELQKGFTVSKLVKSAGGLKEDAFTGRASIIRLNPDNTTQQISFNLQDALTNPGADVVLQREDSLTVSSVFDLRDKYQVSVKGEVRKPGEFAYADSMNVADLIIKAGGFAEGASAKRIEVSRRVFDSNLKLPNSVVAQVFSVDVSANLKADGYNFILKPFDIVSVYPLPGYETQKTVKVEGEVLYPGNYTIQKKNEKISDIIARAGGLTASADVGGGTLKRDNIAILGIDKNKIDTAGISKERADRLTRLQRAYKDTSSFEGKQLRNDYVGIDLPKILANPGSIIDLILEDGDNIRIPKQQQIVRVNGEVLYPSAVVFEKEKSFGNYISNAGGFSPKALKQGAYIVYPNGTVKATRKVLFFNHHPIVKPGSEIYVPTKPERKGLGAAEIISLTTGIASLGAIILGVLSLNK